MKKNEKSDAIKRKEAEELLEYIKNTHHKWNYNVKFCPRCELSIVGVIRYDVDCHDEYGDMDEYEYKEELSCNHCGYRCSSDMFKFS